MAADRGSPHRAGAVHGSARTGEEADEVTEQGDPRAAFVEAACVPLDRGSGHATGTLERAEAILAAHPEVATGDVHTAAILGDDATVGRFLALDGANAAAKGGPREWDALTHLCFSRYLRLDRVRAGGAGSARRRGEREYRVLFSGPPARARIRERDLRRRRSRSPRGAHAPAARAWSGSERWRDSVSHAGR